MLTALSDLLTSEGYRPIIASDGTTGLQRSLEEKPDLILLDVMMPKLDGYPGNSTLAQVLQIPGLIRLSSDLTRVQISRRNSATTWETILDCSARGAGSDIWLQEGDQIEVPKMSN